MDPDPPKIDIGEPDDGYSALFRRPGWYPILHLAQYLTETLIDGRSVVHDAAEVHPTAIVNRSIIGPGVRIFEHVTIRDSIVMSESTIGHACEVARSILLPRVFLPRFGFLGSSLIGSGAQFGGNVAFATHRLDDRNTIVSDGENLIEERWKIGAIVGRDCVVAYGVHTNPGVTIGEETIVHPHVDVHGAIPAHSLVMNRRSPLVVDRRDFNGSPYPRIDDWDHT